MPFIHPDRVSMIHQQTVGCSDCPVNRTQIRKRKRPSSSPHTCTTVTTVQCEYHPHAASHSTEDCRTNKRLIMTCTSSKTKFKSVVNTTKTPASGTCILRMSARECKHHPSSTTHTTAECHTQGKPRASTKRSTHTTSAIVKSKTASQQSLSASPLPRSRQRTSMHQRDLSKIQCYNCGNFGHYSSTCTQLSALASPPTGYDQQTHVDQSLFACCSTAPVSGIS
jgi:hypothetical protein